MSNEPVDLTMEIKKLRSLLRAAKNNPSLSKALIDSLTKTVRTQSLLDITKSRYLSRSAMQRFVADFAAIVASEVNDPDVVDRILARAAKIKVENTASEAKQISMRKI